MAMAVPALVLACYTRASPSGRQSNATPEIAVGAQYDSTHVYVAPAQMDEFVKSFIATFGGLASKKSGRTYFPYRAARKPNT